MNRVLLFALLLGVFACSGQAHAYPPEWTNFDSGDLEAVRDDTMGSTQEQLEERGSVECIACHAGAGEYEGVIDTVDIIDQTMSAALSCMNWEIRGVCIWLTCAVPPLCTISTSIKVKNHVPDIVIQSYDRANGEPWSESQDINVISQGDSDSSWVTTMISWVTDYNVTEVRGGRSNEAVQFDHVNLDFKLVDGYGNPALIAYNALAQGTFGMVCAGRTFPFFPYFISNLDSIAWRWNIPELFYPQSWAVGVPMYNLSSSLANNYGSIYPRQGFMTSTDGLKSGVLSAFRAMHFITRANEPHLYFTIGQPSTDGYWPAGPLDKNDEDTGIFQMLYPDDEDSCSQFPLDAFPSPAKRSDDDSYVWNFWKAYKCCNRTGDSLIYHTG